MTCFFVTNMVGGLDETVLRQVDNLFLLHLPFDDDVRHISKSAIVDQETMSSYVKRLRRHHALFLGDVTRQYPVIIKVKELKGIRTAGETQYFFKPKPPGSATTAPARGEGVTPRVSGITVPPPATAPHQAELPMLERRVPTPEEEKLLIHLQGLWPEIIANIRDKSAFLGSVLVTSRPTKLQDQTLTISFTARDDFHRDMLEDPEYRDLVEKELSTILRQEVTITCQTSDAGSDPRR
jgi:hypothetical protein